ncbi:class I SAM-dependent methyltransferase [Amycolatopsis sp. MtRt-6]|uniref:class I SAM-dependent methyltransferase n=1 Tax=Amycolatopsis sp. MtRt-6 TaxID=2792782 RepID=UPI001A8DF72B|nr:class I SAM-dependent methyltransferase [Amycolatopsis sp. MtRt-6]
MLSLGRPREGVPETIADWYETTLIPSRRDDPLEFEPMLRDLLGPGTGPCLELGCGTGAHAERIRRLGRTSLGVGVSAGMLRHAAARLPVVLGDAAALPIASGALLAVVAVMVHTDMPAYPAVLGEAARVLAPGGVFVHIGVHPCFCGGFADRGDSRAVVIRPGYRETGWTAAHPHRRSSRGGRESLTPNEPTDDRPDRIAILPR